MDNVNTGSTALRTVPHNRKQTETISLYSQPETKVFEINGIAKYSIPITNFTITSGYLHAA